jgi:hypothetical protein
MKSTGSRKDVKKGAAAPAQSRIGTPRTAFENPESAESVKIGRVYGIKSKTLKGVVIIQPEEDKLIGLLDAGKIDEFRQRLHASRLKRRKQLMARVISGR